MKNEKFYTILFFLTIFMIFFYKEWREWKKNRMNYQFMMVNKVLQNIRS